MPWDKRGYYYRKKRIGARVVSEYIGRGFMANLCAQEVREEKHARNLKCADELANRREAETLDQSIAAADELISAAMFEVLEAAGYHRHARGQWRKRRETKSD